MSRLLDLVVKRLGLLIDRDHIVNAIVMVTENRNAYTLQWSTSYCVIIEMIDVSVIINIIIIQAYNYLDVR